MSQTLLHTQSADGTTIAYETDGAGPPLLLIGGALNNRGSAAPLVPLLADRYTLVRFDRRGRGDSGDTPPYAPERELEDIEALIADVGGPVFVYGHSSGAALALHAARRGAPIAKLALYEAPFIVDASRSPLPEDHLERLGSLPPGDALEYFMTVAVGMPQAMVDGMRQAPIWPQLEGVAHTLIYDQTIMHPEQHGRPLPREWGAEVTMPTLVMDGGKSPAWMRNAAQGLADVLPTARHLTVDDCDHAVPPETIAPILADFFGGDR
jgi:pimeloyl-ACP methyl ester carboxylesterase